MSAPRNIPVPTSTAQRRPFGEAFGRSHDAVLSSTAPAGLQYASGYNRDGSEQEIAWITDDILARMDDDDSSGQVFFNMDGDRGDRMVPQQNHQQLNYSASFPGSYESQMYYQPTGELHTKRVRSSNSFSSACESELTQHSMSVDMEQSMAFNELGGFTNRFGGERFGNGVRTGTSVKWSKQPTKHRPQYPNSEGSRGFVKAKGSRNEPTQIKFHGMTGMVNRIEVEIYHAEEDIVSEDYSVVELKKRNGGTRPGDSFPIYDGATHDFDYIGIQVQLSEDRVSLKKRAKECRIRVTCHIRLDSGEQFSLSTISEKFNCSQDASSSISEIEPQEGKKSGGNLMLLTGKNFKMDDSVVVLFEEIYGGQIVWQAEEKPKVVVKNIIVVKIPMYTGPNRNKDVSVNVSVRAGSSNITNTVDFQYKRDLYHLTSNIKCEAGLDNFGDTTCPYRQMPSQHESYNNYPTEQPPTLSTQIVPGNDIMIPGGSD